jgi:hypothetical protein
MSEFLTRTIGLVILGPLIFNCMVIGFEIFYCDYYPPLNIGEPFWEG